MAQESGRKGGGRDAAEPLHGGRISGPQNLIHRNNSPKPVTAGLVARLAMPEKPWKEGREAGRIGAAKNPYSDSSDAWARSSGYIEGRADAKSTR